MNIEFLKEGTLLKHCLFVNEYFAKKDSLILSARIDNQPIETIEVCLSKIKVVQARGLHNEPTEHHNEIIDLVNANLNKIGKAMKKKVPQVKSLKKRDYVTAV